MNTDWEVIVVFHVDRASTTTYQNAIAEVEGWLNSYLERLDVEDSGELGRIVRIEVVR